MNKLTSVLLVTTVVISAGVNAGYGWKHGNGSDRMHRYWEMKKTTWTEAINEQDAKIQTEAKKLLTQIEAKHEAMMAEFKKIDNEKVKTLRREKHQLMNKLDKMLGLRTFPERVKAKVKKVKTKMHSKWHEKMGYPVKTTEPIMETKPVKVMKQS